MFSDNEPEQIGFRSTDDLDRRAVPRTRNVDDLRIRIRCKTHVGAVATRSQGSSMDDVEKHIETPIYRGVNAGKHFRDESQLTRVPSEHIF